MNLPKTIITARRAKGLSQVELAERLDVSPATIAGWETGVHRVRVSRLIQVAKALDLDVGNLLRLLPLPLKRRGRRA